jgi:hypothetical protein
MDEAYEQEKEKRLRWADFVEGPLAEFFTGNKLEKMTVEDGLGNKAKLSRTKDNEIKAESSSTKLL